MKQMHAPQANVVKELPIGQITQGFTRGARGEIFFVRQIQGCPVRHVVLEDKTIVERTPDFPSPLEKVTLIDHKSCGITKVSFV
jgi:hypothetical protein